MPAAHQLPAEQLSFFKPPRQRRDAKEAIGPRQATLGCQGWLKAERASDGAAGSSASPGFVEPSLETLLLLNSKHVVLGCGAEVDRMVRFHPSSLVKELIPAGRMHGASSRSPVASALSWQLRALLQARCRRVGTPRQG